MDPISLIVTALVAGAAAGLKPTAEQAVKDAYAGLKALIQHNYTAVVPSVEQLENNPESKARRAVVEEDLSKTGADGDAKLLMQANAMLDAVKTHDLEAARVVGVSLKDIEGATLRLNEILAQGTGPVTGVEIKNAKISGDIDISGVQAFGGAVNRPSPSIVAKVEPLKLRILYLAADPTDGARLQLGKEYHIIDEQLTIAKLRDRFVLVKPEMSLRPQNITKALLSEKPQIVHFSGHGTPEGALCFEDENGHTKRVEPEALAALFKQFDKQVNCVLLNACYSEPLAKAITEHIKYGIGMNDEISDKATIAYSIGFYQALGAGKKIEEAHEFGCVQIQLEGIPEFLTPVLKKKGQSL